MSEYNDTWSALDTPAAQSDKLKHYNLIMDHLDELNLTDGEKYALGWGHEAVPEDWAKQQAQAIQDRINGMESLNIVKNSRKAAADPAAKEESSDDKSSSSTSSGGSSSGGGGGDGNSTGSTQSGTPSVDNPLGLSAISMDPNDARDGAKAGAKAGLAVGGIPGVVIGGIIGGVVGGASPRDIAAETASYNAMEAARMDRQAQANRDATMDSVHDAISAGDAEAADRGLNSMGISTTESGGYSSVGDTNTGGGGGNQGGSDPGPSGTGNTGNAGEGLYKGGVVKDGNLHGPDPAGPDDGYGALKLGEFVVNDRAVAHYGEDVMQAINQGRIPVQALRRLIGK